MVRNDPLRRLGGPVGILVLTGVIGVGMNALLFRWESTEPVNRRKLALAGLCVFLLLVALFVPPSACATTGGAVASEPW
jgi:hypothetical protein